MYVVDLCHVTVSGEAGAHQRLDLDSTEETSPEQQPGLPAGTPQLLCPWMRPFTIPGLWFLASELRGTP